MSTFVVRIVFAALALLAAQANLAVVQAGEQLTAATKNADGMYVQPWFAKSTGDLARDLASARKQGKVLAVFLEQEGCHYCEAMHTVNLRESEIVDYIRRHFHVVQFDLWGQRPLRSFAGETMAQELVAKQLRVYGMPSVLFCVSPGKEAARLPGYAQPAVFKKVFEYVAEEGYETASMIDWIRARLAREES